MKRIFFLLALAVVSLLSSSTAVFAAATCPTGTDPNTKGICIPKATSTGLSDKGIDTIIVTVMSWLLGILGVLAMLAFVVAGFQYLAAGGDESKTEDAKGMIKYALIGVAVALAGYTIINTLANLTKGTTTGI